LRPRMSVPLSSGSGGSMMDQKAGGTVLVFDKRHGPHNGWGHVECPERADGIWQLLNDEGLVERCRVIDGRPATDPELLAVHTAEHVAAVSAGNPTADTSTYFQKKNDASATAARVAAGSVVEVTEQVCTGQAKSGFCVVRPPGHHAERTHMMGFCVFNNVAVAAQQAKERWGKQRVLIYDWDVHHGNGIQNIFYEDDQVLYISVHRGGVEKSYFYPGGGTADKVGSGAGRGFTVNVPLEAADSGDAVYRMAMDQIVLPVTKDFDPDIVFIAAGFDAALGDPLGGMAVSPGMFGSMTRDLMLAAPNAPFVLSLEGGYNVEVTAECAKECVSALLGDPAPVQPPADPKVSAWEHGAIMHAEKTLDKVAEVQRAFWPAVKRSNWVRSNP